MRAQVAPFESVIDLLPKLTTDEREQIALRITCMEEENIDPDLAVLHRILEQEVERAAGHAPPFLASHERPFRRAWREIREWARRAKPPSKAHRLALYRLGIRAVLAHMARVGTPRYYTAILKQLDKMPALFEHQFPGYIRSGHIWQVIDARR